MSLFNMIQKYKWVCVMIDKVWQFL